MRIGRRFCTWTVFKLLPISFLTVPAHCLSKSFPTLVDPVNESAATSGDSQIALTTALELVLSVGTMSQHQLGFLLDVQA